VDELAVIQSDNMFNAHNDSFHFYRQFTRDKGHNARRYQDGRQRSLYEGTTEL